ncbi:MAG: thiamine phosphate synthase [Bacteroidetes bacterium]|nr:thiamine phosphate synthase [Bacteroidota bacterium]
MQLMVITSSKSVPDETGVVTKMFESGLQYLHLRKPKFTTTRMIEYLNEIPAQYHNRIIIHSHHKLALKFKLKGVHYTSTHLSNKIKYRWIRFRLKFKFGSLIKTRNHTRVNAMFEKELYDFDYIMLGTMFNNLNNSFYSGFYEESIKDAVKTSNKKIVARGGTSPEIVTKCKEMNLYGIAFKSYIWNSPTPYNQYLNIINAFKQNQLPL